MNYQHRLSLYLAVAFCLYGIYGALFFLGAVLLLKPDSTRFDGSQSAHLLYFKDHYVRIRAEIKAAAEKDGASDEAKAKLTAKGSVKVSEVFKVAVAEWNSLSNEDKEPYIKQARRQREEKNAKNTEA